MPVQVHHTPGGCGFARPGLSHQAKHFSLLNVKGKVIYCTDFDSSVQMKLINQIFYLQKHFTHTDVLQWVILLQGLSRPAAKWRHSGCLLYET